MFTVYILAYVLYLYIDVIFVFLSFHNHQSELHAPAKKYMYISISAKPDSPRPPKMMILHWILSLNMLNCSIQTIVLPTPFLPPFVKSKGINRLGMSVWYHGMGIMGLPFPNIPKSTHEIDFFFFFWCQKSDKYRNDDAMMNWDPLITWWKIRGRHFDNMMTKLGALDWGPFALWWYNGEFENP